MFHQSHIFHLTLPPRFRSSLSDGNYLIPNQRLTAEICQVTNPCGDTEIEFNSIRFLVRSYFASVLVLKGVLIPIYIQQMKCCFVPISHKVYLLSLISLLLIHQFDINNFHVPLPQSALQEQYSSVVSS